MNVVFLGKLGRCQLLADGFQRHLRLELRRVALAFRHFRSVPHQSLKLSNWSEIPRPPLFAGSDTGGETLARAMTLIESAKMSGLDPQAYLADVLDRIHDHMSNHLDELLPWNWT